MFFSLRNLVVLPFLLAFSSAQAQEVIPKETLTKFVDEAVEFVKTAGKEPALAEFNNQKGKFWRNGGALYIFAYDMEGKNLALGSKPALKGQNLIKMKDPKGNYMVEKMRDMAKKTGSGYVEYYFENPISKKVEKKLSFVRKIDETWWLGSGVYAPEK